MQRGEKDRHDALAVHVGQSTFSISHKHQNRNAFHAVRQFGSAVDVEDIHRLDLRLVNLSQRINDISYLNVFIDYNRNITPSRR